MHSLFRFRQRFTYGSDSQAAHRLTAISSTWPGLLCSALLCSALLCSALLCSALLFSIESPTHR
ncbi:hypothetical protein C1N56_04800 [Pantoea sp. SGAir0175]